MIGLLIHAVGLHVYTLSIGKSNPITARDALPNRKPPRPKSPNSWQEYMGREHVYLTIAQIAMLYKGSAAATHTPVANNNRVSADCTHGIDVWIAITGSTGWDYSQRWREYACIRITCSRPIKLILQAMETKKIQWNLEDHIFSSVRPEQKQIFVLIFVPNTFKSPKEAQFGLHLLGRDDGKWILRSLNPRLSSFVHVTRFQINAIELLLQELRLLSWVWRG